MHKQILCPLELVFDFLNPEKSDRLELLTDEQLEERVLNLKKEKEKKKEKTKTEKPSQREDSNSSN